MNDGDTRITLEVIEIEAELEARAFVKSGKSLESQEGLAEASETGRRIELPAQE
jgi:hypothetical protein